MKKTDAFRGWGRILRGTPPMLSIEITRECPLTCPGCYAYQPEHLGDAGPLRSLADYKGQDLVSGVLSLVRRHRPLHVSIVGGEPLVRFRELSEILPALDRMGVEVQLVTSAVRPIPLEWRELGCLHLSVSVDGLAAEHDVRRKPATYKRILENIKGHTVVIHCTVTRQMLLKDNTRGDYFREFAAFWSEREEVRKIWFSLYTPQIGESGEEILSRAEREEVLMQLAKLRSDFPKIELPDSVIKGYLSPPKSPEDCVFARTTLSITADLSHVIEPCQLGGSPDCSQCGCMAAAGLQAVAEYRLLGFLPLKTIYDASDRVGKLVAGARG